jgi:hypothetical protein
VPKIKNPFTINSFFSRLTYFILIIHISKDTEEFEGTVMERIHKASEQLTTIRMVLPVTAQVGDEIEIPLVQETGNYYRGYVQEVHHKIRGDTQEIFLWVHPWNHYYYKWMNLKDDYERQKRWLANLRNRESFNR